jgi:hypothetical protein
MIAAKRIHAPSIDAHIADRAERAAIALLETLALTDTDEAFVDLLREELAAAKREGLREASAQVARLNEQVRKLRSQAEKQRRHGVRTPKGTPSSSQESPPVRFGEPV